MENGDSKMDTNFDSYLSARSISTYPYNEELKARLGMLYAKIMFFFFNGTKYIYL